MDFDDLLDLILEIPATFWGVVFGSFFSILGVWLTNRSSTARLLHQFEHERLVKTKDRELSLKKEIYLDAAEAVSAALSSLSNLADLDIPNDKVMDRYTQRSPALAKVQVVGSLEAVQALQALTSEQSSHVLRLFAVRHKLLAERRAITELDTQNAQFQREVERFLEMMKQHNINGVIDPKRWSVLENNFEFEHKRVTDGIERRSALAKQLAVKHLQFMKECSEAVISLSARVIPLLIAVRKELELPLEVESYKMTVQTAPQKSEAEHG